MSITWGSRPGTTRVGTNPESLTQSYVLCGTDKYDLAKIYAAGYAPLISDNLFRQQITVEKRGPVQWDVEVTWGPYEKKEPEAGDFTWGFRTTGGTIHITQSIAHIAEYGTGAVDHKGTLGLNEDGSVEGLDLEAAAFSWWEKRTLAVGTYGWTYGQILSVLTKCVNNATFRGLDTGSVIFDGADGTLSNKSPLYMDFTYNFSYSPNVTGVTVGDITSIAKKGQEYSWCEYRTATPGAGAVKLAKVVSQVNIEQVRNSADFSLLGIGTLPLGS
jgi:hypothetical protein